MESGCFDEHATDSMREAVDKMEGYHKFYMDQALIPEYVGILSF